MKESYEQPVTNNRFNRKKQDTALTYTQAQKRQYFSQFKELGSGARS